MGEAKTGCSQQHQEKSNHRGKDTHTSLQFLADSGHRLLVVLEPTPIDKRLLREADIVVAPAGMQLSAGVGVKRFALDQFEQAFDAIV